MHITVIGCGYLGAVHAAAMAELGFTVTGVDTDTERVATLNRGDAPFHETGLQALLTRHTEGGKDSTGRLSFTTDFTRAARDGDVHFLCVGTPSAKDGSCDLSQIDAALEALAPHLDRPCLIVGKSTVPVGTAERLISRIIHLSPVGEQAELAWNPEFLREGRAVVDTLHPDRIVAGVTSERAEKTLREIYAKPLDDGTPFLATDLPTAELVKVAANSFLALKISFINAVSEVCDASGADVAVLADALGHDERIGHAFLRPGVGYGGGCLPKDVRAFLHRADELGLHHTLGMLHEAEMVNSRARRRIVTMAQQWLGGSVIGKRIAVLGATFKPDTDDVRNSPALDVACALDRRGADVRVCDPAGTGNAARVAPDLTYTTDPVEAAEGADLVLHLTEWREFGQLDPGCLGAVVKARRVIDGRGTLNAPRWGAEGWIVRAPGRPRF